MQHGKGGPSPKLNAGWDPLSINSRRVGNPVGVTHPRRGYPPPSGLPTPVGVTHPRRGYPPPSGLPTPVGVTHPRRGYPPPSGLPTPVGVTHPRRGTDHFFLSDKFLSISAAS